MSVRSESAARTALTGSAGHGEPCVPLPMAHPVTTDMFGTHRTGGWAGTPGRIRWRAVPSSATGRLARAMLETAMDLDGFFDRELDEHAAVLAATRVAVRQPFARLLRLCVRACGDGGKLVFFGNGGSAADAQHLATELDGPLRRRPPGDRGAGADDRHLGADRHRQRSRLRPAVRAPDRGARADRATSASASPPPARARTSFAASPPPGSEAASPRR